MTDIIDFIQDQINNNDFFKGAGLAALLSFLALQSKSLLSFLQTRIIRKLRYEFTIECNSVLYDEFTEYLKTNHYNKFRSMKLSILENTLKVDQYQESYLIRYKGYPMVVSKSREKLEGAHEIFNAYRDYFVIKSFFKKPFLDLVDFIYDEYSSKKEEQFEATYTPLTNVGYIDSSVSIINRGMNTVHFPEKEKVLEDIDQYLSSEKWYAERGIPYKRGYLLYGKPGNGKSSFIRALAYYTKRNIYGINLNAFNNEEKLDFQLFKIPTGSIMVLEDVDSFIDGRTVKGDNISYSSILNIMDGLSSKHDTILVVTTNKPEVLEEAFTREGRIDMKVEFPNPNSEQIQKYLRIFYEDDSIQYSNNPDISYSKLQGLCMKYDKDTIFSKI